MAVMELWRRRDLEGTVKPEYVDGNFFTQDSVGNLVGVKCYKDGAEVALTGSVTGYCVLPSGETVSVAGTRSGNQASILVPQSALAYTGPLGITLKLIDGNTITTLMSIIVVVYRSKTDTVITPSSQIITDWANQIAAALQEVEDASAAQDVKIADLKSAFQTNLYENIAPYPYYDGESKTANGITFTVQNDGSIVANGTATANASFYLINADENKTLKPGTYVLSGNPDGYGADTYVFCGVANPQGAGDILSLQNKTDPISASISAEGVVRLFVMVRSGKTVSNIVFKPMLQRGKVATDYISPKEKYLLDNLEALESETSNVIAHSEVQRGYTLDKISGSTATDASGWMSKYAYSAGFVEKLRIKVTDSTSGYVLIVGANTETVLFISSVSASEAGLVDIPVNTPINEPFYVGIRLAKTAYISNSSAPQYDYSNSIPGTSLLPTINVGQKLSITWKSNMRIYLAIEAFYADAYTASVSGMPSVSEYNLAYASFGMFPTFGVIGDSYASGEIFKSSTSAVDSYYLSWGQTIARMCGVKCTNYSQGGMDTHRFVTYGSHNNGSLAKLLADDPLHMYMLVLGINDPTNNGGISYLGALTDITSHESYTDYPDTFYGNYGKIIEQIQAHAPDAKLVMVTTAYTDSVRVQFNTAIEEIAKHYGLPCMIQLENDFLSSKLYWNTMYYGHPTAVTYSAMAMAFMQMFGKCAYDYYEYFKDYILPNDYPLT